LEKVLQNIDKKKNEYMPFLLRSSNDQLLKFFVNVVFLVP